MMPITFWASLVPWLYEKMPAETSCSRRNHRSTRAGVCRRTVQLAATIIIEPSTIPMIGDSTMKRAILRMPEPTRPFRPSVGRVAPTIPPASACDDEEGSPHFQVRRFQTMAPKSAAKITDSTSDEPCPRSRSKWMMPLPIVFATWSSPPQKAGAAAAKLKKAAQATALTGVRTRVDTTVAIEFAASWKPLMKSKMSATAMRPMTEARSMCGGRAGATRARAPRPRSRWRHPRRGRCRPR